MFTKESYPLIRFGIDEIYFHRSLGPNLLEKLQQRAELSLDAKDPIIRKHVSHDMILIFYKKAPNMSIIYRFLEFLDQDSAKNTFIQDNTLINEEELFSAIKAKKFVLLTSSELQKC